jgi:triosephosphate isomerase (TIM)
MRRKKFIAGNWKMNTTAAMARELAAAIVRGLDFSPGNDVAVFPPFPYLGLVAQELKGHPVDLGAQNLYPEKEGAFTGEVSPTMLLDVGCRYVILGHSERRHVLGESDDFVNRKIVAAVASGLQAIVCVGETLNERERGATPSVLHRQVQSAFKNIAAERFSHIIIAYEPVWAIGTGRNATPEQAQEAHAFLRKEISQLYGEETSASVPIQYGGSVKPENAASLLGLPDVDGLLVGGASLKAESFLAIVRAAEGC